MLAFDIELASMVEIPPGGDLDALGPFELSVAALCDDKGSSRTWHGRDGDRPAARMDAACARDMLLHLRERQLAGEQVVAWNGVGFDLKWLGHAADDVALAGEIALEAYDPMLQLFCRRGFPVSLAAAAEGFGLPLKKSMHGSQAPILWKQGAHQQVIDYVLGDCEITLQVAQKITVAKAIRWLTKRGTVSSESIPSLMRTRDLFGLPPPDQSWMDKPIPRERFFDWIPTLPPWK